MEALKHWPSHLFKTGVHPRPIEETWRRWRIWIRKGATWTVIGR